MKVDFTKLYAKINKLNHYLENDAPTVIGVEAVNHFKESFQNQGFTDANLKKWDDVERRDPSSKWHGFKYKSKVARPNKKRRKEDSITNYAPSAALRPILSGETQELMQSITWEKYGRGALITAATPYAKIQNEGGDIKIFGKTPAKIKARQFMGQSIVLKRKIAKEITNDIKKILK